MSFVAWVLFGLVAGFVGSRLLNSSGPRAFLDIVLGITGAVLGGAVFKLTDSGSAPGLNLGSLLVAVCGAVFLLFIVNAALGTRSKSRPKVRLP
ncbi:MAG: GlsB/YeaQ/YmgE family stress response membrane protein [Polyangiaceae bacterium]